jgi:hypothetical protein
MIPAPLAPAGGARKLNDMGRLCLIALAMLAGGCGAAATGTVSAAAPAPQGRQAQDRVRQQIGAAYQEAVDQRRAIEADGR